MSIAATALVDEAAVPSQQSDSFLLARRSTDEACERLGQTRNPLYRNPWYEPGTDFWCVVNFYHHTRATILRGLTDGHKVTMFMHITLAGHPR